MNDEMTVRQAWLLKGELEKKISFLIREFEEKVEIMKVTGISINRPEAQIYGAFEVSVETKL